MALNYLGGLKSILARGEFPSESTVFRFTYQATAAFLIGSSIFMTANEFFGDPINCIVGTEEDHVVNTYCWIKSTFTMSDYTLREVGKTVAYPGVATPDDPDGIVNDKTIAEKWTFTNYYQWVVFFLCFQAATFYFPKLIWDNSEGGLMKSIATGLNRSLYKDEDVAGRKKVVVDYITSHIRMHNNYVFKYWACEVLCFIVVIMNIYMVNAFLGGEFLSYGSEVIEYSNMDQAERVDPMIYVFPRMTKCTFRKFGSSGSIERMDALCLLPLNILNEKIFILQWFWFIMLACLFGLLILYRILLIALPSLRPRIMHQHNKAVPLDVFQSFTQRTSIGDWWIMYVLSRNIDPLIYGNIMSKLAKEITAKASNDYKSSAPVYNTSSV